MGTLHPGLRGTAAAVQRVWQAIACAIGSTVTGTAAIGQRLIGTGAGTSEWRSIGAPSAFTSRTLTAADDSQVLVAASAATVTINTGLPLGFQTAIIGAGALTFAGTATLSDRRVSGAANPGCVVMQIAADSYAVYGRSA